MLEVRQAAEQEAALHAAREEEASLVHAAREEEVRLVHAAREEEVRLVFELRESLGELQSKLDEAEGREAEGTPAVEELEAVRAERDSLRLKLAAQEEEHVVEATNALQEVGGALQWGRVYALPMCRVHHGLEQNNPVYRQARPSPIRNPTLSNLNSACRRARPVPWWQSWRRSWRGRVQRRQM